MILPLCEYRGEEKYEGLYACSCPKLVILGAGVTKEHCERCPFIKVPKLYLQIKGQNLSSTTIELGWEKEDKTWKGQGLVNGQPNNIALTYNEEDKGEIFLLVNNSGVEQKLKPNAFNYKPFYVSFVFSSINILITT